MDRTEMLKRIAAHYRTFWSGNVADIDGELSKDFVDEGAPPGTPPGTEFVKMAATVARAAFPDMKVTVDDSVVGGNVVAVRAKWRGTNTGPFMGKPASGKTLEFSGMVMWRFDAEGRIDRRWTQMDMASVFKQLEG